MPVLYRMRAFSMLIALVLTCLSVTALQAQDKKGGKAPPLPDQDPAVVQAKAVYDEKSRVAADAKAEVTKLRGELGRQHAQTRLASIRATRGSGAANFQKSDEQMKAEQAVKQAEAALKELLYQLHENSEHREGSKLFKELIRVNEELENEQSLDQPNGKRIIELSTKQRDLTRKLSALEEKIFALDDDYKAGVAKVNEAKKALKEIKAQARMSMRSAAPQPVSMGSDVSGLKANIASAVEQYSVAYKDQQMAKQEVKKLMQAAAIKYGKWQAEQRQKQLNKNNGGKGKKGKGKKKKKKK